MKLIKLKSLELPKFRKYEHTTEEELKKWCGENPAINFPKVGMIVAGKTTFENKQNPSSPYYATMINQEYTDRNPAWEEYNSMLGLGWASDKYFLVK